jgi:hypothetical protein
LALEQQRGEVKTEGSEKRIKAVRSAGKRALNGAIFGAGLMIPVLSGGWLMTKHIRDEADTLINDKLERVEKTGNGWIFTFKKENTDKVVPELQGVNNNSCMLVQTLNGTPVSTTLPPQIDGDKVCEVTRDSQQNAAGRPLQRELPPTTVVTETVTTLQPQGDAAP